MTLADEVFSERSRSILHGVFLRVVTVSVWNKRIFRRFEGEW